MENDVFPVVATLPNVGGAVMLVHAPDDILSSFVETAANRIGCCRSVLADLMPVFKLNVNQKANVQQTYFDLLCSTQHLKSSSAFVIGFYTDYCLIKQLSQVIWVIIYFAYKARYVFLVSVC